MISRGGATLFTKLWYYFWLFRLSENMSESRDTGSDSSVTEPGERETIVEVRDPDVSPKPEYRVTGRRAFGRYELLIEMGRGGMATLFLAQIRGPQNFEKLLAIKKIHNHLAIETEFVHMFLDEARISALIQHPNVASIFDLGKIDDSYFIAMEYIHGQNLNDVLKGASRNRGVFGWEHACHIVADAAAGLHAAHELKRKDGTALEVVHRDVSPHNILISYDGHVKVVDFGIAYAAERVSQTKAGTLKGKVGYMAPEQTSSAQVDRRADVFCLGILLYEMCTLRRLFRGATEAETIMLVRAADVPQPRAVNPDIPIQLERILLRTLQADPDRRYATAEQLSEELDAFLIGQKKRITRSGLAELMEKLFYDRRRLKDEQIQHAMDDPHTDPLRGVGSGQTTDDSLVAPETVPKNRSKLVYSLVGGAAVVIAITTVLIFVLGEPDRGNSPRTPADTPAAMDGPASRAPLPNTVKIRVNVEPSTPGTVVVFRGKSFSGQRLEIVVTRSNKTERIRIRAPGFREESLVVVPLTDSQVTVKLQKAPEARAGPMSVPRTRPRSRLQPRPRRRRPHVRPMGGLRDFPD